MARRRSHYGSFAKGFIDSFLAASTIRMQQEWWEYQKGINDKLTRQKQDILDFNKKVYEGGQHRYDPNPKTNEGVPKEGAETAPGVSTGPLSAGDRDLAIRTVFGEANGQGDKGMSAVASVIRNRSMDSRYGDGSVRDVITAPKQFSLWNQGDRAGDSARALSPNSDTYKHIGELVDGVWNGSIKDPTNGADHYYRNDTVSPAWGDQLAKDNDVQIGAHRFVGKAKFDLAPKETPKPAETAKPAESTTLPKSVVNFDDAAKTMNLSAQEKALYKSGTPVIPVVANEKDGKVYNVPTVYDGKTVSNDEAFARAEKKGWDKFPSYDTQRAAQDRSQQVQNYMGKAVAPAPAPTPKATTAAAPKIAPADAKEFSRVFGRDPSPAEAAATKKYGVDTAVDMVNNPTQPVKAYLEADGVKVPPGVTDK